MRKQCLPAFLFFGLVAIFAACSSGDEGATNGDDTRPAQTTEPGSTDDLPDADNPSPPPTPASDAENDLARSLLLTVNDFPTGWSETPPSDDDEEGPLSDCDLGTPPGATGTAESGDFSQGGASEISHGVVVFDNPTAAESSLDRVQQIADCIIDIINDGGLDTDEAEFSDASFGAFSFPMLGDASDAYRFEFHIRVKGQTGLGSQGSAFIDMVRVIEGRLGFAIQASDVFSPFDAVMLEDTVRKAHDKLLSANQ